MSEKVDLSTAHAVLQWAYAAARDSILRQTVAHNKTAAFIAEAINWYEDAFNYGNLYFRLENEALRRKLEQCEAAPFLPDNKHSVGYHTALKHLRQAINEQKESNHAPARIGRLKPKS